MDSFHALSVEQTFKQLNTSTNGLSLAGVRERRVKYGSNILPRGKEKVWITIFIAQWKSALLLILLGAGVISLALGEYSDGIVILGTALLNACIGFFQEYKADRALRALRTLVTFQALVVRERETQLIPADQLVIGDVVILHAGDKVSADGRIFEANDLEVNEASLTGESLPVKKNTSPVSTKTELADRANMLFNGTVTTRGEARMIVTAIGKDTEIGKIAQMVGALTDEETPLQKQLGALGRTLGGVVITIAVLIFVGGIALRGVAKETVLELFKTAVAVAVAAVPEGLAVSLTVILAIGMQRILKRNALVRRMLAAETLGSVTVICTDKTGTLTEGVMRATRLVTKEEDLQFAQLSNLAHATSDRHRDAVLGIRIAVLCNDGVLKNPEHPEAEWQFIGDTTDTACVYLGMKAGIAKHHLDAALPRRASLPFDSSRMYMASLHDVDAERMLYVKGAPEVVLARAAYFEEMGEIKPMTSAEREWFAARISALARQGLRLLGLAYRTADNGLKKLATEDVNDLVMVGILALSDPLRPGVKENIALAEQAGIRTIMITGDHRETAQAIAEQLGLSHVRQQVIEGRELSAMNAGEVALAVQRATVFARVEPAQKIQIVQALERQGEVVAMTGDGVNDAPALKAADIGVAFGSGTDVAKEVSDMVLLDNSFATIVAAVEEGRRIYHNIKKIVLYLLAGSFAEVLLITDSIIFGIPLAVLPAQILWINLIQDSFPNIALAFDRGGSHIMKEKPRSTTEKLLDGQMKMLVAIISVVANVGLFALYWCLLKRTDDVVLARTVVFVSLGAASICYIYSIRSMRQMIWRVSLFDNPYVTAANLFALIMLVAAVQVPFFNQLLNTTPLSLRLWALVIGFGLANVLVVELCKAVWLAQKKMK